MLVKESRKWAGLALGWESPSYWILALRMTRSRSDRRECGLPRPLSQNDGTYLGASHWALVPYQDKPPTKEWCSQKQNVSQLEVSIAGGLLALDYARFVVMRERLRQNGPDTDAPRSSSAYTAVMPFDRLLGLFTASMFSHKEHRSLPEVAGRSMTNRRDRPCPPIVRYVLIIVFAKLHLGTQVPTIRFIGALYCTFPWYLHCANNLTFSPSAYLTAGPLGQDLLAPGL